MGWGGSVGNERCGKTEQEKARLGITGRGGVEVEVETLSFRL